jgi:hypothetical protein
MNETLTRIRHRIKLYAIVLIGCLFLLGLGYFEFLYHYTYSSGESVGYVQKLSLKGWVCKTWEGEQLRTISLQPSAGEKFYFTVRDESVVEKINANIGERVILIYAQHPGLPECFGETAYFVEDAKLAPKN